MKYYVSRQRYWPEGTCVVEIAMGGGDYANSDMLSPKFQSLGEAREFDNAEEALEAAFKVQEAWRKISHGEEIHIASGFTAGMTMPFEPESKKALKKWAEKRAEVDAEERENENDQEEEYREDLG